MSNGRFNIYLRRRQNTIDGNNVTVQCDPLTGFAQYTPGDVDNTWVDFTDYIEGAEKLSFTWDRVNTGNSSTAEANKDGSNIDKGITSDLMFFGAAYEFIYAWLMTSECQILNAVEVKVVDLIAGGTYRIFEIKNDNIEFAPYDEPCQLNIKLREQDTAWHCIHRTFIFDNWQGWFKDTSTKQHPCFLTCIEPRPRLVQSVRMGLLIFIHSCPFVGLIDLITGFNAFEHARDILNANRFVDAPLIRTYIQNVAGKCGMSVDTIFDEGQEWENLCLYYPSAGYMYENNGDTVASPGLAYHYDNRWLITIAELFDKLKPVFAAEWYVTPNNTIVFKHTKDLIDLLPIYDFTAVGAEPFYDLRYTFNGDKKPAYGRYQYQDDGSDLASQEISTLYNDIIDYDGPANNPMLEGDKTKNLEFAPTGFVRDGRAKDYIDLLIRDGKAIAIIFWIILVVVSGALLAGGVTVGAAGVLGATLYTWMNGFLGVGGINRNVRDMFLYFVKFPIYTGAVRLTSEQTMQPRLLLWDGISMQRAKVEQTVSLPTPNPYYNTAGEAYDIKNKINEHNDNPSKTVYNYPLYFDGDFTGNLFDKYHDKVDNPLKSLESHQNFSLNVDLCEGMLNLLGVYQGQYIKIGRIIKIEERNNYSVYGRIGNIQVDNDANKIVIKGKVLRRSV